MVSLTDLQRNDARSFSQQPNIGVKLSARISSRNGEDQEAIDKVKDLHLISRLRPSILPSYPGPAQ